MGKILAVCVSEEKGTAKHNVGKAELVKDHGIQGDAHAGKWHRQVSLLSHEKIEGFRSLGAGVKDGDFGENLVVEGIDLKTLPVGTILRSGNIVLEITQIGKECHRHCEIYHRMGDCIMPREGVFARVLEGGIVSEGDEIFPEISREAPYKVAIITASDKGYRGERLDESGAVIRTIAEEKGYEVASSVILPDERFLLEAEMRKICDEHTADLILTTGGTGFSERDCMPEATLAVADRAAPGIAEAMRVQSMNITKRAMLSRAESVIRGKTLIVNLPGSPKAVRENLCFIIDELKHGLDILTGRDGECARSH